MQKELKFDKDNHIYYWYNKKIPNVTTILSDVGVRNSKGIWESIGFNDSFVNDEIASDFGIAFHNIAAIILRNKIPSFPEVMLPWIKQFNRFIHENPLVPVCDNEGIPLIEYPIYSERYEYCGTLDLLAMTNKEDIILYDWKTSTTNQSHWSLQTAAYENLIKEVLNIRKKIIRKSVRFTESAYVPQTYKNHMEDFTKFLSCFNVYKIKN